MQAPPTLEQFTNDPNCEITQARQYGQDWVKITDALATAQLMINKNDSDTDIDMVASYGKGFTQHMDYLIYGHRYAFHKVEFYEMILNWAKNHINDFQNDYNESQIDESQNDENGMTSLSPTQNSDSSINDIIDNEPVYGSSVHTTDNDEPVYEYHRRRRRSIRRRRRRCKQSSPRPCTPETIATHRSDNHRATRERRSNNDSHKYSKRKDKKVKKGRRHHRQGTDNNSEKQRSDNDNENHSGRHGETKHQTLQKKRHKSHKNHRNSRHNDDKDVLPCVNGDMICNAVGNYNKRQ